MIIYVPASYTIKNGDVVETKDKVVKMDEELWGKYKEIYIEQGCKIIKR